MASEFSKGQAFLRIAEFRRSRRLLAYSSTWFGCTADLLLDSSAILILFMSGMGASPSLILLAGGISSLVSMFLQIPAGSIVDRMGAKRGVYCSCGIVIVSFFLIASAPFWGRAGNAVVIAGVGLHAVSKVLWNVSWYLILGNILRPKERGTFLGTMRFSYYLLNAVIFFVLGIALETIASIEFLQSIFIGVGLLSIGRILVIARLRMKDRKITMRTSCPWKKAFLISLSNGSLVGAAIYTALICFAFAPVPQLALIHFKETMQFGDGTVQLISSVGLAGNIVAALCYGKLLQLIGMRFFQIAVHLCFLAICASFAFCIKGMPGAVWICGGFFFCAGFAFTCFGCNVSREMLALARPGNEAMATSFSLTYQMFGTALGRLAGSQLLGSGCLSSSWLLFGHSATAIQTLFLGCGALLAFQLILLPLLPSVGPRHHDYYKP